jgi:ATP-dependent exoDNAse (exonuclease V) beta subunit
VPSPATLRNVPDEERAEALLQERSLLYVASSRARDALVVTWSGKRSELLGQS